MFEHARAIKKSHEILAGFFQLGYVTNDFEKALEALQGSFENPYFEVLDKVEIADAIVGGKAAPYSAKVGLAMCGDTCIELIQPLSGDFSFYKTMWKDDEYCFYLHHLGCIVGETRDDINVAVEKLQSSGISEQAKGSFPGLGEFSYLDARSSAGVYLELVALQRAGRAFFEDLKERELP